MKEQIYTEPSRSVKEKAKDLGFDLVGIAPLKPVPGHSYFQEWLKRGYGGTMTYLNRGAEKRGDPERILPGVKSVISCGLSYHTGQKRSTERTADEAWISAYCWGEDYHEILLKKLEHLEKFIHTIAPDQKTKCYVDTGPVMEKAFAAQAGLGWIGKNTCLINNGLGSFIFLGEILTTLELEADAPVVDQCGSCTRCIDACPTQALVEPYVMDARRCISYLTLEYKGEIEPPLAAQMDGHLAGCDICQEVCPYNEAIPLTREADFFPRSGLVAPKIETLFQMGKPNPRLTQKQWERNLKIAAKN